MWALVFPRGMNTGGLLGLFFPMETNVGMSMGLDDGVLVFPICEHGGV
jgi:hypothetical protein